MYHQMYHRQMYHRQAARKRRADMGLIFLINYYCTIKRTEYKQPVESTIINADIVSGESINKTMTKTGLEVKW